MSTERPAYWESPVDVDIENSTIIVHDDNQTISEIIQEVEDSSDDRWFISDWYCDQLPSEVIIRHVFSKTGYDKGGVTFAFQFYGVMVDFAFSVCSKHDQYNKKIGRELATARLDNDRFCYSFHKDHLKRVDLVEMATRTLDTMLDVECLAHGRYNRSSMAYKAWRFSDNFVG